METPISKSRLSRPALTSRLVDNRYKILKPMRCPTPDDLTSRYITSEEDDLFRYLESFNRGSILAFDTETTGLKIFDDPTFRIVGLGLCGLHPDGDHISFYLDLSGFTRIGIIRFFKRFRLKLIERDLKLICHNLFYDASVVASYLGYVRPTDIGWLPYKACTYGLFHYLAAEGFDGQSWGLKGLMTDLLLWPSSNEDGIDNWLVEHGFANNKGKAQKGEMWRVPAEILGDYCQLDCYATLLFYTHILQPAIKSYTTEFFTWFHEAVFLTEVRNCVDAYQQGVNIDIKQLHLFRADMKRSVAKIQDGMYRTFKVDIDKYNREKLDAVYPKVPTSKATERPMFDFKAEGRHTKGGKLTTRFKRSYLKYKQALLAHLDPRVTLTKAEATRRVRRKIAARYGRLYGIAREDLPETVNKALFNFNSTMCKRAVLYKDVQVSEVDTGFRAGRAITLVSSGIVLDKTDSGELPTGKAASAALLGPGNILDKYNAEVKKLQFTESVIEKFNTRTNRLHLPVKIPGTVTCRLGGDGGCNVQNQPKSAMFLKAWKARSGYMLCQMDLCLRPDMEILTRRGWISSVSILATDAVWQVDPITLQGSWVVPSRIIKRYYEGDMHVIKNVRGEVAATTGHDMLYLGQIHSTRKDKEKLRYYRKIEDLLPSKVCCMATNTTSDDLLVDSPCEITNHDIWMACMLQADGSRIRDGVYTIEVAKLRKRAKVMELLGGRSGTINQRVQNGKTKLESETWRVYWKHPLLNKKTINVDLLNSSHLDVFLSALSFWDGSVDRDGSIWYTSCNQLQIDMIQSWLVRHGYECKKIVHKHSGLPQHKQAYRLVIRKKRRIRIRQVDKSVYYYEGLVGCVTVPSGFILIRGGGQTFVVGNCAVEPTVFAELSRDKTMMSIYGPGAPPNDVYLAVGARLGGSVSQPILDEGYDPDNPTKDAIARCKDKHKKLRNVFKTLTLSDDYGSGAFKKWQTLRIQRFDYTLDEVREMHDSLARVFQGKKAWAEQLKREHIRYGGFVLDAFGMPTAVDDGYVRDIPNRVVQKSGHMILMLLIYRITQTLWARNMHDYRWYIVDLHDETILEVPIKRAREYREVFIESLAWVNEMLKPYIPLKAEPQIAGNLAEIKVEKYRNEDEELADLIDELNSK